MATTERASERTGFGRASERAELSRRYLVAKRSLDLIVATIALVPAIPIALVVMIALKIDSSGPVFFRQRRVGQHGQTFRILKFRTMYWPCDPDMHIEHVQRLARSPLAEGAQLRLADDPRVTRVGRMLRNWSLDELPNLWNVLRGEMSMVGPRPLVPYEFEALGDAGTQRSMVKPGVTGLAQIQGRLDVHIHARSDFDTTYITECSLSNDLLILINTPIALLRQRGI